jgi:hypothetical protein
MPYCENCGTQLNPNAKFCGNCGAAISKPATNSQQAGETAYSKPTTPTPIYSSIPQADPQIQPPTQASGANSEVVVGTIIFKKPKSLGRWDTYTGVLTNQRLIFAQMTNEMMKAASQQSREQAKAEGKGFFGQWSEQLKGFYGYTRRYLAMQPSVILAETPGNFALDNNTIREIKLKDKTTREDQGIYEFEVQIHSSTEKYEFIMEQNGDYTKLLKQVFGERVKTPFGYVSKTINIKF